MRGMNMRVLRVCLLLLAQAGAVIAADSKVGLAAISHPTYPITALVPRDWTATAGRDEIIPSDSWTLAPAGANVLADRGVPCVTVLLGWRPRLSRQSAFFPGDRLSDARAVNVEIGGHVVNGVEEGAGRQLLADFEAGELVVSVRAFMPQATNRELVLSILRRLRVDE
jgi:hypothetical protein